MDSKQLDLQLNLTNEAGLVDQAVADPQAFLVLYDRYFPAVYNYVRYRCQDAATSDDLTAQIFERALTKLDNYKPRRGSFSAWLFAIARNTVAGYYRGRRPSVALEQVANQPAPEPSPPEAVMHREELARLLLALATLSDREQEIVRLKFGAGLSNMEIGKVMRLRAGHVAVILYRALRKLRPRLEEE